MFKKLDANDDGKLDSNELARGLAKLDMKLSQSDVKRLMARYDDDGDGYMDYAEFVDFMEGHHKKYERIKPFVDKLRQMIKRKSHKRGGMRDAFEHFDRAGTGFIGKDDFARGLDRLGFDLSKAEARRLQECFDLDGDGRISYIEFVDFAAETSGEATSVKRKGNIDDIADNLKALIRKARRKGIDYKQSFEHFDTDYSGDIDKKHFQKGLRALKFDLSDGQVRQLMARFESSREGHIKYRDFLRFVAPSDEATVEEVSEKLRKKIRAHARTSSGRRDWKKPFKHFERNSRGKITRIKFKEGLELLNFDLTDSEVRMLIDKFDEDRDGLISYEEFVDFAKGGDASVAGGLGASGSARKEGGMAGLASKLRLLLRKAVREGVDYRESFEHFDTRHTGAIGAGDFRRGMEALGFDLARDESDMLLSRFDANGDGRVDYREFLRFVRGSSESKIARIAEDLRLEIKRHAAKKGSLRSPFNHFDRNKRKRFTLKDFVEGVRDIGFEWSRADSEKVFAHLDLNGDGRVSFKEFKVFVKDPNFKDVESRARVALMRAAGSASPFEHSRRYAMFSFLFGAYIFYAASLARRFCFARLEGQG